MEASCFIRVSWTSLVVHFNSMDAYKTHGSSWHCNKVIEIKIVRASFSDTFKIAIFVWWCHQISQKVTYSLAKNLVSKVYFQAIAFLVFSSNGWVKRIGRKLDAKEIGMHKGMRGVLRRCPVVWLAAASKTKNATTASIDWSNSARLLISSPCRARFKFEKLPVKSSLNPVYCPNQLNKFVDKFKYSHPLTDSCFRITVSTALWLSDFNRHINHNEHSTSAHPRYLKFNKWEACIVLAY